MSKRHTIYALVIVLLLLAYGWKFGLAGVKKNSAARGLSPITAAEDQLNNLRTELARKQALTLELEQRANEHWPARNGVVPLNEIQKTLLQIGKTAGVSFSYVGTPTPRVVNEHLRTVEITVRAMTTADLLQRFLQALTAQRPRLQIETCNLRPDSTVSPKFVTFDGKIRAYVIDSAALKQLKEAL